MKAYLLLFLGVLLSTVAVWAQDPGSPDTVYFKAAGLYSADGDTLYVYGGVFPADVEVDVMIWTDNGVSGVSLPFVEHCYDQVSMPTYLDYAKNHPDNEPDPHCFTGTLVENWAMLSLGLNGVDPTPTPPNFLIGAVVFTDSFYVPGLLAHLIFTVNDTGCLCLDTIPAFYPGAGTPGLITPNAVSYVPQFIPRCFSVELSYLEDGLTVQAYSPVDLIVTDPRGDSIGIDFNTIRDATYDSTQDLNGDGDLDDLVTIPHRLVGDYLIEVVAESGDSGEYTVGVRVNGSDEEYLAQAQASPPPGAVDSFTYYAPEYMCGDPDGDWHIMLSDVICLANNYFGKDCSITPGASDVNCDEVINLGDAIILGKYYFGIPGFELNCCD